MADVAVVPSIEPPVAPDSPPPPEHEIHEATPAPAPPLLEQQQQAKDAGPTTKPTAPVTPPTSEEWKDHASGSDLSDLELDEEEEEDIGEVEPDHYYEGGKIPVFKPTMDQFRSFKKFVDKIDKYGMKSGIVKVIPPKEWRDSLSALDEAVKTIKVKNPITQEFAGAHGTYTQANIEKQRSYNLPQWKALTEESQHQPPAKRGERRKNTEKPARPPPTRTRAMAAEETPEKPATGPRRRGRPAKSKESLAPPKAETTEVEPKEDEQEKEIQAPPTPTSPNMMAKTIEGTEEASPSTSARRPKKEPKSKARKSSPKPKGRQPKTVAERRKYNRAEMTEQIDESAFEDFDYRFYETDMFTPERCAELESLYWRTLTFAAPMYGADMPGSLFDESTTSWNVAKLENLLDVLGQKVPGVNTAYLYLGMWKATFAWHLEDVDLYSINYIHFGAPKQWYSISQEDARRFENAMKSVWPNDAKNCSQFLRHKTYLISPQLLQSQFNIKVNKLVHYEGEFVITFPYGYHSGYNMGYNCAESVNFATEAWLDFGRIAKKCDCEADSVWIDVWEVERKLRGEPTPEYIEETEDEDDIENAADHLPSPPASVVGKSKLPRGRKRKNADPAQGKKKVKKIKIRIKNNAPEPCALCPNHLPLEPLLRTDDGRQAHLSCALYTPETYIANDGGIETVCNISSIDKARLDLKCSFCRSKKGACFQCSAKKCTRAFHATCAAPGGVQVECGPTPVYGEDGTEYAGEGYDFRCRFHRPKRPRSTTTDSLESNALVKKHAQNLQARDVVQMQYLSAEIFAGYVVENRPSERTVVVDILPDGDRMEVEWKWILVQDPADSHLLKPSPDAKPLPEHLSRQISSTMNAEFGPPREGDAFGDAASIHKWAEFHTAPAPHNRDQTKIDFDQPNKLWYYLAKTSTEAKPQYTEDLANPRHNPASVEKPPSLNPAPNRTVARTPKPKQSSNSTASSATPAFNFQTMDAAMALQRQQILNQLQVLANTPGGGSSGGKPYQYKPKPDITSLGNLGKFGVESSTSGSSNHANAGSILAKSLQNSAPLPGGQQQSLSGFPANPYALSKEDGKASSGLNGVQNGPIPRFKQWVPKPDKSPTVDLARLKHLAASENRPPQSGLSGLGPHAQRIQKYPYLRQAFCRRDPHYISPYTPGGGYSGPYSTFLPRFQRPQLGLPQFHAPHPYEPKSSPLAAPSNNVLAPADPLNAEVSTELEGPAEHKQSEEKLSEPPIEKEFPAELPQAESAQEKTTGAVAGPVA